MVTPTPKKHSYSRKNKSLGLLCENFIQTYNTSHVSISIDDAARALGVERRRIYDIINIFESLDIVARKCKNTYNWLGISDLPQVFGRLQEEAFKEFAQDAVDHGILQISPEKIPDRVPPQKKSLGRLSQQFLQLFLVGHSVMALTDASDKILGESSMEDLAAVRVYSRIGLGSACLDISLCLTFCVFPAFQGDKPFNTKANPCGSHSRFENQDSSSLRHCQRVCVPGRLPSLQTFVMLFCCVCHSLTRYITLFFFDSIRDLFQNSRLFRARTSQPFGGFTPNLPKKFVTTTSRLLLLELLVLHPCLLERQLLIPSSQIRPIVTPRVLNFPSLFAVPFPCLCPS